MVSLNEILRASASRHSHLCPRQVLGARIGLAGAQALDLQTPQRNKLLFAILETDGCFADGVEAATGCSVGHRSMPEADLLSIQEVCINIPVETLISRPGARVNCELCGEEIIHVREVQPAGITLCQACARGAYYQLAPVAVPVRAFNLLPVADRRS